MKRFEAPAKLNLSLHVMPPGAHGYHPLDSMVQTVEWVDYLNSEPGEGSDTIEVVGADLSSEDNLVLRAARKARDEVDFPPLRFILEKNLPVAAGLGGGSSDAAAALLAVEDAVGRSIQLDSIAELVGADVSLFLSGGTIRMTGFGEQIERLRALDGFAVAVVVPDFGLSTTDVYAKWDEMEGPTGTPVSDDLLPPPLRGAMPMRNDLLPAALELDPRLGDFMADVRSAWGTAVCLTGSGSACFGYFGTVEEADDAASAVSDLSSVGRGVALRARGARQLQKSAQ